jgi:lysozyme
MFSYTKILTLGFVLLSTTSSSPVALEERACTGPNINAATVALIKEFEGFVASPAPDPIGLPTVGYGHLCKTSGCGEVPYSFPLTQATASQLLASDLKVYALYLLSLSSVFWLTTLSSVASTSHNP